MRKVIRRLLDAVVILIILFFLLGCVSEIPSYKLKELEEGCKDHGGIYKIDTFFYPTAICNDGTRIDKSDKR